MVRVLFSVIFLCLSVLLFAQKRSVPYDYPITKGEEWAALNSKDKDHRVQATQVPDSILRALTTEALLETVLTHPLNYAIVFYDSPTRAVQSLSSKSNAYQELLARKDGPRVILRAYQDFDPEAVTQLPDSTLAKTYFYVRLLTLGVFMADDRFLTKLSSGERKELVKAGLNKIERMRAGSQTYSFTTMSVLALPMVKILYQDKTKLPKDERSRTDIERYVKVGSLNNQETLRTIENSALAFIK